MRRLHDVENCGRLRAAWERLESHVLDYVVNLMRQKAYVDHTDEINSPYALVPIIVYCFDKNRDPLTDTEIQKLVKWFFYSQIRTRYVSQLPQKLDRDLRTIATVPQPFDALLQAIAEDSRLPIQPTEFVGRAIQNPLFSMMRWYFKSRGAVCLTTGMTLRQNMGSKYQLERDHIFPYSLLKDAGYGEDRLKYQLAQELTNRVILTQVANRTKSDTEPSAYLASAKRRFPKALELQCVPEDPELWKVENYERFLEARREILADQLNRFLGGLTSTEGASAPPVSVEDLIGEGESDELEFKSTLRWDLATGEVNTKLEYAIVKTIAGFANSQGGTLVVGVADDGTVLGLQPDYASSGKIADRDGFELHLRALCHEQFGVGFVSTKLVVRFHVVDGKDVCQVDIQPATAPLIVKAKDKNGQLAEKFYVRSGNASQELPLNEMNAYLKERFRT
jgi:hypothetical protein